MRLDLSQRAIQQIAPAVQIGDDVSEGHRNDSIVLIFHSGVPRIIHVLMRAKHRGDTEATPSRLIQHNLQSLSCVNPPRPALSGRASQETTMTRHDTPKQDFKRIVARELAAFEQKENEMNASERRDRARALGLPLALAQASASGASAPQ
jgi:hypothetical protein